MRTPIRHEGRDGVVTYYIRFRRVENGKRRETSETFDTEAEALRFSGLLDLGVTPAKALAIMADEAAGVPGVPQIPTLDEWAARYIDSMTGITDGTRTTYRRHYAARWSPHLGSLPLDMIERDTIGTVINNAFGDLSDNTLRKYHRLLASILAGAVDAGVIDRNVTLKRRLPRRTDHEHVDMVFLTQPEFWTLYEAFHPHWRPLLTTLAGTGIRIGEAEALAVGDIDLDAVRTTADGTVVPAPVVHITKTAKYHPGKHARDVGPTKTPRSRRSVLLPAEVAEAIAPLVKDRPATDRLFVGPNGAPIHPRNFWQTVWHPSVWRAQHCPDHTEAGCRCGGRVQSWKCPLHKTPPPPCGCPGTLAKTPRVHDLRHTHVAWLIGQGVSLPVIQRRLGHVSITTTNDRYGHLLPDVAAAAADAANVALAPMGVGVKSRRALPTGAAAV